MQDTIGAKDFYLMTKVNRVIIPFLAFVAGAIVSQTAQIDLVILSFFAIVFTYAGAATLNDIFDKNIDQITNSNRPIPQRKIEKNGALFFVILFAAIGIITAYLISVNYSKPLFFWIAIVEFLLGYLYSAIMSRHFVTANGTLATTHGLIPFYAAAYLMSSTIEYPIIIISAVIWILLFLTYNLKDLKDAKGDMFERKTLPVIFGTENAKKINIFLLCSALPISIIGWFFANKSYVSIALIIIMGAGLILLARQLAKTNNNYEKALGKFRILMGILIIALVL